MKRLGLLLVVGVLTMIASGGCMSPDASCRSYGYERGTEGYAGCRERRSADTSRYFRTMSAAYAQPGYTPTASYGRTCQWIGVQYQCW